MGVCYVSREAVKVAASILGSDANQVIDRLIESTSRQIESLLGRHFYPLVATRAYAWPSPFQSTSLRLYLDEDLLAETAITSGDAPMTDYVLQPVNDGPPYSRIEVNVNSADCFLQGAIPQASIIIEGVWGYSNDVAPAGALVGGIDNSATALEVSDASLVGVGDLIFINDEAMIVTGRSAVLNASLLDGALTASQADAVMTVDDGSSFCIGEIVLVDAERMLIVSIMGNTLIVKRAYDGSVLAAHEDNSAIYVERSLTVVRGQAGTTAAAHGDGAPITRNVPPGLIADWCLAEVLSRFEQEKSHYGRNIGQGEGTIEAKGVGLKDLRQAAIEAFERKHGPRAI